MSHLSNAEETKNSSNDYQKEWIQDMENLNRSDLFEILDKKDMEKSWWC